MCYIPASAPRNLFFFFASVVFVLDFQFRWLLILWRVLCVVRRLLPFTNWFGSFLSNLFSTVFLSGLSVSVVSNFFNNFLNGFCFFLCRLVLFASCFGYYLSNIFLRGVVLPSLPVMRVSNFFEQYSVVGTRFRGPRFKSYDLRSFSSLLYLISIQNLEINSRKDFFSRTTGCYGL